MEQKYSFVEVSMDIKDYDKVKEVYRLHKEQSYKIFDLACGISSDEDIIEYVKERIEYDYVFLAIDNENNNYAGAIILEDVKVRNNIIVRATAHLAIGKRYWGKKSREIIFSFYKFLKDNWLPINRIECMVPENNYGIIKLLKDVGFKVEGTCKDRLLFKDKNGNEKLYNELIYSNMNVGEINE